MKAPKAVILKVDEKNAIVIRMATWKETTKVYIQGGYTPAEGKEMELMVQPCDAFPNGLAYGKAVTCLPHQFAEFAKAVEGFNKALGPVAAPTPTNGKAKSTNNPPKKNKGTKIATNAVVTADHGDDEDELDPEIF